MPRIPVRVEPYSSPSRQHRHYKNKRDQVLRALGKAAYINGSHFAIMWVSARGDVETYASEALQGRLDDWFVKGGIAEEAKQLVVGNPARSMPFLGDQTFSSKRENTLGDDDFSDDQGLGNDTMDLLHSPTSANLSNQDDPFLDSSASSSGTQAQKDEKTLSHSKSAFARKGVTPLDTHFTNQQYLGTRGHNGSKSAFRLQLASLPFSNATRSASLSSTMLSNSLDQVPQTFPRFSMERSTSSSHSAPQCQVHLKNQAARTTFLGLRFGQLQQGVCKTVAKAWIKIIEPKKQTRCPYNKGDEGKPSWWPEGVRHKEPDHLMKPERHALLLTILRSPKIQVARLQLATAEVVALIKADKVSLLMDAYRIAREEEKMREANMDMDSPISVQVSTLDGWSDAEQAPTLDGLDIARSMSPEPIEKASIGIPARKRTAAQALTRSASCMSVFKRRSNDMIPSQEVPGNITTAHPAFTRSNSISGPPHVWTMSQLSQNSLHHQHLDHNQQVPFQMGSAGSSSTSSSTPASGIVSPSSYSHSSGYGQMHGLATPITANSQLMDPAYMAASACDSNQFTYGAQSIYTQHASIQHRNFQQSAVFVYPEITEQQGSHETTATSTNTSNLGSTTTLTLDAPQHEWNSLRQISIQQSQSDVEEINRQHWSGQVATPSVGGNSSGDVSTNISFDSTGPRTPSPQRPNHLGLNLSSGVQHTSRSLNAINHRFSFASLYIVTLILL